MICISSGDWPVVWVADKLRVKVLYNRGRYGRLREGDHSAVGHLCSCIPFAAELGQMDDGPWSLLPGLSQWYVSSVKPSPTAPNLTHRDRTAGNDLQLPPDPPPPSAPAAKIHPLLTGGRGGRLGRDRVKYRPVTASLIRGDASQVPGIVFLCNRVWVNVTENKRPSFNQVQDFF